MKLFILFMLILPAILFVILMFKFFGWIAGLSLIAAITKSKEPSVSYSIDEHEEQMRYHRKVTVVLKSIFLLLVILLLVKSL